MTILRLILSAFGAWLAQLIGPPVDWIPFEEMFLELSGDTAGINERQVP